MELIKTLRLGPPGKTLSPTGVEAVGEAGTAAHSRLMAMTGLQATGEPGAVVPQIIVGGSFGNFEEIEALFSVGNIYKYTGANATVNPLDESVTTTPNTYGWFTVGGGTGTNPTVVDTVTDPVRGTVQRVFYNTGMPGGGSPRRWWGPSGFRTLSAGVSSALVTRSGTVATRTTLTPHGLAVGDTVYMGSTYYGGFGDYAQVQSVPTSTTFTFLLDVAEVPTSPNTNTVLVQKVTLPTKLGFGCYVMVDPTYSDNGNVATKWLFLRGPNFPYNSRNRISDAAVVFGPGGSGVGGQNHYVTLTAPLPTANLLTAELRLQAGGAVANAMNFSTTAQYPRGRWVKMQAYFEWNTGGLANGKVRIWGTDTVTGVKTLHCTSDVVPWSQAGQAQGLDGIFFDPTFGGGPNPVPADQSWYQDDFLVATQAPAAGTVANPLLLPAAASTQVNTGTYARGLVAGQHYFDPISGIPVVLLTSPGQPTSGDHGCGYANSGPQVSQPWVGSDGFTYYTFCEQWSNRLIDVRYDLIGVSDPRANIRSAPWVFGETSYAWSMNPATPRILYRIGSGQIVRYDTAAMALAPSGIFPKTVAGVGAWFQTQLNDTWMAWGSPTYYALNVATGTVINVTEARSGFTHDELHLDLTLPVVYCSLNSGSKDNLPWLIDTDTLTNPASWSYAVTGAGASDAFASDDHCTPIRGGVTAQYFGGNPYSGLYALNYVAGTKTAIRLGAVQAKSYNNDHYHSGCCNLFGFPGAYGEQWAIHDQFLSDSPVGQLRTKSIGYYKLDGSQHRYICGTDTTADEYFAYSRAFPTVDGKLVFFTTNRNNTGPNEVCCAKIPTS